jgi:hypothetical protein
MPDSDKIPQRNEMTQYAKADISNNPFSLRKTSLTKGGDDPVSPFNVARQEHLGPPVNPVGEYPVRGSGCCVSRRQVASLDRRIFTGTNLSRRSIMLRTVLLGLLIPFGVGVLAAMELRTPPRSPVAVVQPVETTVGISDSHVALAKADRLEIAAASSETPAQPSLVDERISPSEDMSIGSSEPPRVINHHRHYSKSKKVAGAFPKSKPKKTDIKRTIISERSKAAGDTEPCRLSAFGGLRKALNSIDCEI